MTRPSSVSLFSLALAALSLLSPALAASRTPLISSQASFFYSDFCRAEGCRFVGSGRSLAESGGYWIKDYRYRLRGGAEVEIGRYDDPAHPESIGDVIYAVLDFRGNGNEPLAVRFASLGLGRTVTAPQLAACFAQARKNPAAQRRGEESWLVGGDRDRGAFCRLEAGWMKRLVVTIVD
ncbi:MAG: hypothetical protein Q4C67_03455 [Deinococcus sp.]|nr:hypothetical protein [Deinococcus sp.]